jgi:hypothetical protein
MLCIRRSMAALALSLAAAGSTQAADWKPIDPAVLALKQPRVEKGADAEAVFWDVRVEDDESSGSPRALLRQYLRNKIFTDRGRQQHSQVDLEFSGSDVTFGEVAARTIKADGTILEVKGEDIHTRTLAHQAGEKVRGVSFAFPGVEPGAVVEYTWRETRTERLTNYIPLPLQRDIPVWTIRYSVKPLDLAAFPYPMRAQPFNIALKGWAREANGVYTTVLENVGAFRKEPFMPPEDDVRAWMLVYYAIDRDLPPDAFWRQFGQDLHREYKDRLKPSDTVVDAAGEIAAGAGSHAEKLAKLAAFCRTRIKNASDEDSDLSDEERARAGKDGRTPRDLLRDGFGRGDDIDVLFGALAAALGFDVRVAVAADRGKGFFEPALVQPYLLPTLLIAVGEGAAWNLYQPSSRYVPAGRLRWQNEGVKVLVADAKSPVFVDSSQAAPEATAAVRKARLRLTADGVVEGDVEHAYSGHRAEELRETYGRLSPASRGEALTKRLTRTLSGAEISGIAIEAVEDVDRPLAIKYHVRMAGYAQQTGRRLFFQPSFFEKGHEPRLTGQERRHHVYFHYPWADRDRVTIELPAGFELDHADTPGAVEGGAAGYCRIKIGMNREARTIVYDRDFRFGGDGPLLFDRTLYPSVKQFFDLVDVADDHTLTLKQSDAP